MEVVRYLADDGTPLQDPPFEPEELRAGYRHLRRARFVDDRAVTLQRQGRLGVYPPYRGQEAAQVGTALALEPHDWVVPSYRESAVAITHGLPLAHLILFWRAHPAGWRFPDHTNVLPFYIPIATQIPQAVGIAHAAKLRGESSVAAAYIGDGGTSEGDFHEGLNFAAVFDAPVLFVVQNNGWAISVPTSSQMKTERIAERARGYGIPGVVVDGNDLVAVWATARDAVGRARNGEGPTLLEAVTYRVAPHTTSDDPGRYRDETEAKAWQEKDPIRRMRRALDQWNLWTDDDEGELTRELKTEFEEAVAEADRAPEPEPWEIVEHVFETMSPDQQTAWEALHGDA